MRLFDQIEITPVRSARKGRLRAFVRVGLGRGLFLRNIKIIEDDDGRYHVFFPSVPLVAHCPHCETNNPVTAFYCNHCGGTLAAASEQDSRGVYYRDILYTKSREEKDQAIREILEAFYRHETSAVDKKRGVPDDKRE